MTLSKNYSVRILNKFVWFVGFLFIVGWVSLWAADGSLSPVQAQLAERSVVADAHKESPTNSLIELLPLSDIYSDGPPQVINIRETHASVSFVSSIPVACSVVYGTDSSYGSMAVDLDMDGGAHTEHQPLMAGLSPDTEYTYRLQGTDTNGNIYVGEPATFRTAPATTSSENNVASLSAGAQVLAVSSNFGGAANDGTWGANSAIDENPGTAWSSNGDGDDAFLELQLSAPAQPTSIEVWTRTMSNGTAQIFEFQLTAKAADGTEEIQGPFTLADANQGYRFDVDFGEMTVHSIRLDVVSSNGGNTGLVEFVVYAAQASAAQGDEVAVQSVSYLPAVLVE